MIILPIFTSSDSNNHYPSSSVEYKETRVISKYRDEMKFYFKLKDDISGWTKFWNILDNKFRFVLHSRKQYTKSIKKDLEAGMDFGDVYHKYKELADLGESTVYDEFCGDSPKNIESFLPELKKYYEFDSVYSSSVSWYERDYSSRTLNYSPHRE